MHYNDQGADFKYLIVNERDKRFGLSVTTVGFQAIRAGSVYPPRNHPDAYYFTAQKGRVLHEYQLVYITSVFLRLWDSSAFGRYERDNRRSLSVHILFELTYPYSRHQ